MIPTQPINTLRSAQFPDGLTVATLKQLLQSWPDTDPTGQPTRVWIGDVGQAHPVCTVSPLNVRTTDNGEHAELELSHELL